MRSFERANISPTVYTLALLNAARARLLYLVDDNVGSYTDASILACSHAQRFYEQSGAGQTCIDMFDAASSVVQAVSVSERRHLSDAVTESVIHFLSLILPFYH